MSILTDNVITRFINSTFDKVRLATLLTDDVFKYFFTADLLGGLRKYLYLLGIGYMAVKTTWALASWWQHWGWTFNQRVPEFNVDQFKSKYGQGCWVVVTGFASGIGLTFAKQFAELGYNLVLVDCQKERSAFSERWVRQCNKNIHTKVIILDLTADAQTIADVLHKETEGLEVGIVVNNAGMSAGGEYIDIDIKKLISCFRLNALAAITVTKQFLPSMLARKHHRSAFINIGSGIGQLSSPLTGIYPATKEFLRIFSRSLDLEQGQNNLDVLCVKPLGVITNMMSFAKHDWTMVTPSAVVTPAIQALGHQKETFGAVEHKVLATVLGSMTEDGRFEQFARRYRK